MRWSMAEGVLGATRHVLARVHGPDRRGHVPGLHIERAAKTGSCLVRTRPGVVCLQYWRFREPGT